MPAQRGWKLAPATLALAILIGLPILGVWLAGKDIANYTEFPPLTRYAPPVTFSWPLFICTAVLAVVLIAPFELRVLSRRRAMPCAPRPPRPFPWWGWAGVAAGCGAWVLAWTRFPWFDLLQPFTFSPLWFAYIVVVNALTHRRTGRSMLTHRPGYLLLLFVVSAGFWWLFEYLNRFVQNWYYVAGGREFTKLQYFIFATLPFSTVLPGVLGTYEFLVADPRIGAGLDDCPAIRIASPRVAAALVLSVCCAGLAALGLWPQFLYPLLWLAPLLALVSLQALAGRETVLSPVAHGDWRRLYVLAVSALMCGLFWEMWNVFSMAQWRYEVPFVGRFKLFEMPVLGYLGYLPFGVFCGLVGDLVQRTASRGASPQKLRN